MSKQISSSKNDFRLGLGYTETRLILSIRVQLIDSLNQTIENIKTYSQSILPWPLLGRHSKIDELYGRGTEVRGILQRSDKMRQNIVHCVLGSLRHIIEYDSGQRERERDRETQLLNCKIQALHA